MKKTSETYKRKIFFTMKLALLVSLIFTVFRTILILRSVDETFVPKSTAGAADKIISVGKESIEERDQNYKSFTQDYSAIYERDLFKNAVLSNRAEKEPKVDENPEADDRTEEELRIALLGTVAGSPGISRAIIEDLETNILGVFKVGDTIGNASIETIERDTVVLLHQGQRKIVHQGAGDSRQDQADKTQSMFARNFAPVIESDPQDDPPTTVAEKLRYAATMLPKAVLKPYTVEGKVEGLRITGLEEIKYMENIGLKNGDVVRTVNGHRLTSKQVAFQISKKARSQENVSIELMRDNQIKTFSFQLGQGVVKSRDAGREMKTDADGHIT
ncbi:MAG: hypothetical protein JXM79_20865 [Sedimentisphaerales bacterium]|nr:hypothetical protein [Sedimentisphaerales bacterium]